MLPGQILRPWIILTSQRLKGRTVPKVLLSPGHFGDLKELLFHEVREASLAGPGQPFASGHCFHRQIQILARFHAHNIYSLRTESTLGFGKEAGLAGPVAVGEVQSTLARPSFLRSPCIGGQNLSPTPVPPYLQWVMPILRGTGNTLLCSRLVYGKRISTRAKSVNSEPTPARTDTGMTTS
jgi:hypothetical protein